MKKEWLAYLVCPECKTKLKISNITKECEDDLVEGNLICEEDHNFNISNGIPRLLPKTKETTKCETQESFSRKWTTDSVKDYGIAKGPVLEFHHKWYLQRYGWDNEENFKAFL